MRKLLFSTVALTALITAPVAMADPNDNPKQHDTAKPDHQDKSHDSDADRGNGPNSGATGGPAMMGGPNGGNADRNNDNNKTVIHNDNDRTVNRTVVHKTVERNIVLKVRANIRAPHRYRAPRSYVRPIGWYPHRWVYGERLPHAFFAPDYFILDFAAFGLFAPWDGYEWVRYGDDALLIDVETGEVIRVEYDVFY